MTEEFRDIKGFEGRYQVSNLGRVYSLPKQKGVSYVNSDSPLMVLKNNLSTTGYYRVNLGRGNMFMIHRLVAESFIPKIDGKKCVNHKDGDKLNNHIDNLEWCTQGENIAHARLNRLMIPCGRVDKKVRCTETGIVFKNIKAASDYLGVNYNTVRQRMRVNAKINTLVLV